jgi:large subunit ribosomal protein L23
VGIDANKRQVKRAIENFYGVQVESVRTLVVRGKVKRFGRHFGKRKNWKKAYVTLTDGNSINIYE